MIQYNLCDVTICCESSVFMWLHTQPLVSVCVLVPEDNTEVSKHVAVNNIKRKHCEENLCISWFNKINN
jgi:hypothetical protein